MKENKKINVGEYWICSCEQAWLIPVEYLYCTLCKTKKSKSKGSFIDIEKGFTPDTSYNYALLYATEQDMGLPPDTCIW